MLLIVTINFLLIRVNNKDGTDKNIELWIFTRALEKNFKVLAGTKVYK